MLLDLAGLDKNERTMIQASIGNARDFDKIAEALVVQHPRVHLKAQSSSRPKGAGKGFKGKGFGKVRKGGKFNKGKRSWNNARLSTADEHTTMPSTYWDVDVAHAFIAETDEPYSDLGRR